MWANGNGRGKVGGSRKNFSGGERRAEERVRLLKARGSAELRKVASGSVTQGLWPRNGTVRPQVRGKDRSRFLGRRTVREISVGERRGRRASDRAKERRCSFWV